MKKAVFAAMLALAGLVIVGCVSSTKGGAGDDKVGIWQAERTPVAVLTSNIQVKAAGAIVEALDVAPYGLYKSIADKVDKAGTLDRYRRLYLGYVGDVKALEEQGKSREEASKEVLTALKGMEGGQETLAKLNEYLKVTKETNFEVVFKWIVDVTQQVVNATSKFAEESPKALQQIVDIAKKEGGMAVIKIPAQAKDDLAVIGDQLEACSYGLTLYKEMMEADKKVSELQVEYPIEG